MKGVQMEDLNRAALDKVQDLHQIFIMQQRTRVRPPTMVSAKTANKSQGIWSYETWIPTQVFVYNLRNGYATRYKIWLHCMDFCL
jgi:hypothetical protein